MAVQHLAHPLRVTPLGRFATVEQGSAAELAQSVAVVLATPIGSRVEVPEFGAPQATFDRSADVQGMLAAVTEWVPDADVSIDALTGVADENGLLAIKAFVSERI